MNTQRTHIKNFIISLFHTHRFFLAMLCLLLFFVNSSFGATNFKINDLYFPDDKKEFLTINKTSSVQIFYEKQFQNIALATKKQIKETHNTYSKLFGEINNFHLSIKIINKDDFFAITKIPNWINAIYYKKNIIFPIEKDKKKFDIEMLKSLRHEYMHAYIYQISHGKCIGWLDEGLAQWAEGSANPKLWGELQNFLLTHNSLSLTNLANSYMTLPTYLVPVAYAESLIGVKYLINYYGFDRFKILFKDLYLGLPFSQSFINAFNIDTAMFDYKITSLISSWKVNKEKKSIDKLINFSNEKEINFVMGQLKKKR